MRNVQSCTHTERHLLAEDCNFVSINHQLSALCLDLTMETAVCGVILEHVYLDG